MDKVDIVSIAEKIIGTYHACLVDDIVHFFTGGIWHAGDRKLDELIVALDRRTTRANRNEIRDLVSLLAPEGRYAPSRYIAFKNGVLDVETLKLLETSPDLLVPNQIPWCWDRAATSAAVEGYLDSTAADDPSVRARIEEMLGAALYRGKLSCMFIIVGMAPVPRGDASNGKSTLAELCFAEVGGKNSLALDIQAYGQRFMAANIAGKLVVGSTDAPSTRPDQSSLSVLKRVVTGDTVSSDTKNGPLVEFKPYATVILAANKEPPFLVDSGLQRRPVVIPLKRQFPKNGPNPLDDIVTDDGMPALLVHAVSGLRRLLAQGPTPCPDGDAALGGIIALSSTVEQWADDSDVQPADLNGEPCTTTYLNYSTWCSASGEKPLTRGEFDAELQNRWPRLRAARKRYKGQPTTKRWFYGGASSDGAPATAND